MAYVVGIDEVGRGPLAGPVTVCLILCEEKFYLRLKRSKNLPGKGFDSKKLSPENRQKYAKILKNISAEDLHGQAGARLQSVVVHISNKLIDENGINWAIKKAIEKCFEKIEIGDHKLKILLDGGLKAPDKFQNQKTVIKGDEREKIIAWASILAKVSRDNLMCRHHKKFPQYGFHEHKGYGTKSHRESIKKYGLSCLHRKYYCRNVNSCGI